ncbi:PEP-CTERM sorting domain-containing protein [Coleofasciculus sp.]|uniref:PEP-CTERM sorting domain-containing protein n=1 Tax=Coleofasciculus sp. TaxID=3100458 RepID=UPI003A16F10F
MKLFPSIVTSATIVTTAVIGISSTTYASSLNFNLLFETSNQSIWDTGNAFNFTHNKSLGLDWDKSVNKGFTIFGKDVGFNASTNGRIGLDSTFNLNDGTVNAKIPIDLSLVIPDKLVSKDEKFIIQSGFSFADDATFTTSSPSASYDLDFIFDVAAGIGVNPGFNRGFDIDKKVTLVSFDTSKSPSIKKNSNLGEFEVSIPNVSTTGSNSGLNKLTSSGKDSFLEGTLDLDYIATTLFDLKPLESSTRIDLPLVRKKKDPIFSYNLLDVEAALELIARQTFSLTGTLPGLLSLENGTQIPFNIGENVSITMPDDVGRLLKIDALIDFNALFHNTTSLGIDFDIDALVGKFSLKFPKKEFSVGPMFEKSANIFDTDIDVYNKAFDLGGFNQEKVSFYVKTDKYKYKYYNSPEPLTILGSATALGFGALFKRQQSRKQKKS